MVRLCSEPTLPHSAMWVGALAANCLATAGEWALLQVCVAPGTRSSAGCSSPLLTLEALSCACTTRQSQLSFRTPGMTEEAQMTALEDEDEGFAVIDLGYVNSIKTSFKVC